MSLLMDALKKAEEAKRQSEAAAKAEPQGQPPAETPETAEAEPQGLPELPSRLELLDHEFHAAPAGKAEPTLAAAPPPRQPAGEAQKRERAAAQNVFQAKQPAPRRMFPLVVGGATLLAAAGIGGYFWWQLQPKSGLGPGPATARTAPPPGAGADRRCPHCAACTGDGPAGCTRALRRPRGNG